MTYSLKKAGEATGRTKLTILRAIQTARYLLGEWKIDPAELHRAYPPVTSSDTRTDTPDEEEIAVELLLSRQDLAAKKGRTVGKPAAGA